MRRRKVARNRSSQVRSRSPGASLALAPVTPDRPRARAGKRASDVAGARRPGRMADGGMADVVMRIDVAGARRPGKQGRKRSTRSALACGVWEGCARRGFLTHRPGRRAPATPDRFLGSGPLRANTRSTHPGLNPDQSAIGYRKSAPQASPKLLPPVLLQSSFDPDTLKREYPKLEVTR